MVVWIMQIKPDGWARDSCALGRTVVSAGTGERCWLQEAHASKPQAFISSDFARHLSYQAKSTADSSIKYLLYFPYYIIPFAEKCIPIHEHAFLVLR